MNMNDFKAVIIITVICFILFGGLGFYITNKVTTEQQSNIAHCKSTYICEKGVMDYQEGQCVCSKVFPISRKTN
jgi:Trk-type K+ transport system membrane component